MAEYLIKNYEYVQTLREDQIFYSDFNFDVFRAGLDYKRKIQSVNPPLPEEEYLEELYSDKKKKKYYYNYKDEGAINLIEDEAKRKNLDVLSTVEVFF